MTNYPGHYRYQTNRGLPGFDPGDPQSLAKDAITPLPARDGMRFQVDISTASPEAAASLLNAKLGLSGDLEFTADDIRPAS